MKRCCFSGHGDITDSAIKERLKELISELLANERVEEFFVGNYGQFDAYAASAVKDLKTQFPKIKLVLVVPYLTKTINEQKEFYQNMYDEIVIADTPPAAPPSKRIIKANEYMVNASDYMICYVDHTWGGAHRTLCYAEKKGLKIINIAKNS